MNRREPPFVGHVSVAGFVIDVGLVGETEARRRVLAAWSAGSSLREVDETRWLLTLPHTEEVRCELAPGLPLEEAGDGLAPAGTRQTPPTGALRTLEGGRWIERRVSELPSLEPGQWIDLGALAVHLLNPLERVAPAPARIEPPAALPVVDLRSKAKLGPRSSKVDEMARDLAKPQRERARRGAGGGASHSSRGALARLLLRSPAAPVIRRKHAQYLRSLTEAFEGKHFDEALRDAIALADGDGTGFTALRLPRRRGAITGPTATRREGGGAIPWGPTVHEHLSTLYREAAAQLEKAGRVEEAAFVLADLMGNAPGAVALLERHRRFALAAELADGREMSADLVVRLHWRAGHRQRALEVARGRGAYAAAIKRLEPLDADQARQLRAAWAQDLSLSGDHLAAVEAAWPDPELRPSVVSDIQTGMALGGPTSAHLFAYLLAYQANSESRAGAIAMLRNQDPQLAPGRDRFLAALSDLPCSDPTIDRDLATAALRVMMGRETAPAWDEQTTRRTINAFSERADPLLRADLPSLGWQRRAKQSPGEILTVDAPENPGQLPVHDVAALAGGALLVAHGNHGARLLTLDGRTRARWDIPTHRLVVADHGGTALLANDVGDRTWELHTLNLATQRVRPWLTIRVNYLEPSFDGVTLTVIDEQGTINFLDTQSDRPTVLWRELNDIGSAVALSRSPGLLSAVVRMLPAAGQPAGLLEQWHWELPGITLRDRSRLGSPDSQAAVTSSGIFLCLDSIKGESGSDCVLTAHSRGHPRPPQHINASGPVQLVTSGPVHALVHSTEDNVRVDLSTQSPGPTDISIRFPAQTQPHIRAHGDTVAAWDVAGRIVAVDTAMHRVICSLRTRL